MESVFVPTGLNLLVDVDSTPELNLILVEGSIIFAPDPNPAH
jgi:coenzyme F420-reducing hydrogenase gamma subunit